MIQVTAHQAQAELPKYLAEVAAGNTVVVTEDNRPVAEIRPVPPTSVGPRPIGWLKGKWELPESFFEPLPNDLLDLFEAR